MQLSHSPAHVSASFDEPNLSVSAGLVPAVRLAEKASLADLAGQHVSAGANPGAKVMSLVAGRWSLVAGRLGADVVNA